MSDQAERTRRFLELHHGPRPLLLANAWDVGSAKLLAHAGMQALASTSSGYAATLGRLDYGVGGDQAIAHAATLVAATELPVSADLEDCFAADANGVGETVRMALEVGLAGASIEDWDAARGELRGVEEASERVAAAAAAAHDGPRRLVLTARAENHLRGNPDSADTIARLRSYLAAGADVLYAPGLRESGDIRAVVQALPAPVNVLALPGVPPVEELGEIGVARVSVGGGFAFAALGAALEAASELLHEGTYGFAELSSRGSRAAREAFAG